MRGLKISFIVCLLLVMVVSVVTGQEVIRISSGPWAPYSGEDLPHYGFISHVISEAFAREGYDVEFTFMPWVRAYNLMVAGQYDASSFWYRSEERTRDAYYSDTVNREQIVFFYKGECPVDWWDELEDLANYKIGATRGLTYTDEFWELANKGLLNVFVTDSEFNSFSQLILGRLDLLISSIVAGMELLRVEFPEETMEYIGYIEQVVSEVTGHLLFPRGEKRSREYLEAFNRGLAQLIEDGTYDELYERLLQNYYSLH